MIPEFPLPTVDADFYQSQIYQISPIFGNAVHTPQLIEPTTFFTKIDSSIVDSFRLNCLQNAVKRAAIRQRNITQSSSNLKKPIRSTVGSLNSSRSLTSVISSFVITQ